MFRLVRIGNLVMLCGAMLLTRHMLILPILELNGIESLLSQTKFNLLTLAVVLAAASGYIINNLMDVETDRVNGKERGLEQIGNRNARLLYFIFTIAAVVLAFIVGDGSIKSRAFLSTAVSCGLLYFYAVDYKRIPVLGNVVVSVLTAFALAMPMFCDESASNNEPIRIFVIGYAMFAFLLSLSREIIKSCEDMEGDAAFGIRSIAVVAGTRVASIVASLVALIGFSLIATVQYITAQWENTISFYFVCLLVQLPLAILCVSLFLAKTKKAFGRLSTLNKFIMATGLLTMAVFYLTA
ncbi:MAG: geranylgeranylglycerol-phosphate geranylgeranyltransferase [Bacteroidota bacterium]